MKIRQNILCSRRRARAVGFSIVELQIGVVLTVLVVGAMIASNIFGLRMFQHTQVTLSAMDDARSVLGKLREEVRSSTMVIVGSGKPNAFYDIDDNTNQIGTALQIFPGTNTNTYLIYYRDTDQSIKRWSTDQTNTVVLAHYVTNLNVFTAQDFAGNTLTNNMFTRVIQIILQFSQDNATNSKYGGLNDFFEVQTKATRRK
jgi:hypothetical protein